jgi:hypothetical protein
MTLRTAETLAALAEGWLWIGAASALVFLLTLGRVEPSARGAWVFRPLLIPGVLLLWPLVWWRFARLSAGHDDWRARHRPPLRAQGALALALVVAILGALALGAALRQAPPFPPSVSLGAP